MKKIALFLLLCPLLSTAQKAVPRFEKDTLYTTSGYKIYKGQILRLAIGTASENGKFRFVKLHNGLHLYDSKFHNTNILVNKLSDYEVSGLGNIYIRVRGTITYKDSSKTKIDIDINFDRAIENFKGLPSELIVPDEFTNKRLSTVTDEIERLYKLYKNGALSKEEYEDLKRKVVEKN